jgi:hypothetical protein
MIAKRIPVSTRKLLAGSVQIWGYALAEFGLSPIPGRPEIFWWPHVYDGAFLGYMEGALNLQDGNAYIV